jgi:phosphopantothenoylcysteine decarboxylase / phosphopantothenate---cysteine ligase
MKKIVLGISGSIAAYKAALLTRLFVKQGIEIQVLMTESATGFIGPMTLSTLSKRPVHISAHGEAGWNNHVDLGLWADAMIVAPASANTLAKMANGHCDNILTAVYLSARCPVFVAPAMDVDMWHHPATARNLKQLQSDGVHLIPVGHGELASGLIGDGRMAEPEDIVAHLQAFFATKRDFAGKKALVTAGPTFEHLDPVRFIGNHSSGKMGIAIAESLAARGAEVTLVLGPSHLRPTDPKVKVVNVQSAQNMYDACAARYADMDITVLAAAVADYRPATFSDTKIKKKSDDMRIDLAKTIDIAATLGQQKRPNQMNIGFALETNDETANAQGKLERKNFDFVVLNSLRDAGAGFGHDTNKVTIIHRNGHILDLPLQSKTAVAEAIVQQIAELYKDK